MFKQNIRLSTVSLVYRSNRDRRQEGRQAGQRSKGGISITRGTGDLTGVQLDCG